MPFNVTSQVAQVSGVYANPYLVHNAGTATAYLGTSSALSVGTQSLTLVPGASLNWNGSDSLWVICAPGDSTVIETLATGTGHSAPGPSSVSLTSPVAIDPNSNAVSLPGGATVNGNVGSYGANNPVLLANALYTFGQAAGTVLINILNVNQPITAYASLIIGLQLDNSAGTVPALNATDYIDLTITQYIGNTVVSQHDAQWLLTGVNGRLQIPVIGTSYSISGSAVKGANTYSGAFRLLVIGSSETITAPVYVSANPGLLGSIPSGGMFYTRAFAEQLSYIASKSGPASIVGMGDTASTASSANLYVCEGGSTHIFFGTGSQGSAQTSTFNIQLPMRPLYADIKPVGTNASIIFSIAQ